MVDYEYDARKIAYLIKKYPNHKLEEIISLLEMPQININCAIWKAVELSLMDEPQEGKPLVSHFELDAKVEQFDKYVTVLAETMHYAFNQLAKVDADFEENKLMLWSKGYANHDILIAINLLLDTQVISKYSLVTKGIDGKNEEYLFYTLVGNRSYEWGRKQFKVEAPIKLKTESKRKH